MSDGTGITFLMPSARTRINQLKALSRRKCVGKRFEEGVRDVIPFLGLHSIGLCERLPLINWQSDALGNQSGRFFFWCAKREFAPWEHEEEEARLEKKEREKKRERSSLRFRVPDPCNVSLFFLLLPSFVRRGRLFPFLTKKFQFSARPLFCLLKWRSSCGKKVCCSYHIWNRRATVRCVCIVILHKEDCLMSSSRIYTREDR